MNNFKKIAADAAQKYTNLQEGWNDRMDDPNTTPEQMRDRADMARERAKDQPSAQKPKPKKSTYTLGFQGKSKTMTVKKEEVEQMDEADIYSIKNKKTGQIYHHSKYPITKHTQKFKQIKSAGGDHVHATIYVNGKPIQEENDIEEMSGMQMKKREDTVKSMKKNFGDFRQRYGDKAKSVMYATATKQAMKEDEDQDTEDMHYCAKHVYSDLFGEGFVLEGQHAEPNDEGEIDWYMVEFDDGIRKIPTHKLEIMVAEYHMNHKKKKKMMEEEEELDEMSSKMKMKLGLYGKKKKMMEEDEVAEAHDGNLANNAPPYDKVTHGDVITGRLGKDHQGGKSKHARERSKYQAKGVPMGPAEMLSKLKGMK